MRRLLLSSTALLGSAGLLGSAAFTGHATAGQPAAASAGASAARAPVAGHALGNHGLGYGVERHGRHARPGFNIDGGNWAGYVAEGAGFSSVTATWTEPRVRCNSTNDLFAPWVGIDGYDSYSVEQTGVATDCASGRPAYRGWYEMYPADAVYYSNPVGPGDVITATVTRRGSRYTLTLRDRTRHWSRTTTRSTQSDSLSAEVVIESPNAAYPAFGAIRFSGAAADGRPLAAYGPVALDASNDFGSENRTGRLSGGRFVISYLRE